MKLRNLLFRVTLLFGCCLSEYLYAEGQAPKKSQSVSSTSTANAGASGHKTFVFLFPTFVVMGNSPAVKAEINFIDATFGIEGRQWGMGKSTLRNDLREKDQDPKESMTPTLQSQEKLGSKGGDVSLSFSRYSQPIRMAGAHWSLGAGYRSMEASWDHIASPKYYKEFKQDTLISNNLFLEGPVYTARLGYRVILDTFPLVINPYLGITHFESSIKAPKESSDNYPSPTTQLSYHDQQVIKRKYMSSTILALELGFAF